SRRRNRRGSGLSGRRQRRPGPPRLALTTCGDGPVALCTSCDLISLGYARARFDGGETTSTTAARRRWLATALALVAAAVVAVLPPAAGYAAPNPTPTPGAP